SDSSSVISSSASSSITSSSASSSDISSSISSSVISSSVSSSVSSSTTSSSVSSVDSSSSSSSIISVELRGTAAIGAPIAGGTITVVCTDGSSFVETTAVLTNGQGNFSGHVRQDALPCALRIGGGLPAAVLRS